MGKKKWTYLLLPLVVLLWGYIFWQVFDAMNPSENAGAEFQQVEQTDYLSVKTDSFELNANYKDPFLGNFRIVSTNQTAKPVEKQPVKPKKPEKIIPWPAITYGGLIKNRDKETKLALVKINNKDNLMQEGDILSKIRLLTIYKDSIEVVYNDESRMIGKK